MGKKILAKTRRRADLKEGVGERNQQTNWEGHLFFWQKETCLLNSESTNPPTRGPNV